MSIKEKKQNLKPILSSLNTMKGQLNGYIKARNFKGLKSLLQDNLKDVQGDLNRLFDLEVDLLKKKFQEEKESLEKLINFVIQKEIQKAQTFIDNQRKELHKLQKKIEGHLVKEKKAAPAKPKRVRRKTTKKLTKKASVTTTAK